jgi:hypothetical protein
MEFYSFGCCGGRVVWQNGSGRSDECADERAKEFFLIPDSRRIDSKTVQKKFKEKKIFKEK